MNRIWAEYCFFLPNTNRIWIFWIFCRTYLYFFLNILYLNSIFENCSLLTFIPNISKWKFNKRIEINNIFKGCNSLIIIPDISKWNIINIPEDLKISSFSSNSISIKEIKSDLKISEDNMKSSISPEDSSSLKDNKAINSFENINTTYFSNNEELADYYDNFYN